MPANDIAVSIRDSEGKLSTVLLHSAGGALLADDIDNANDIAALIAAVSDGVVANVTVTYQGNTSNTVPAGNVDNEIKARFGFLTTAGTTSRVGIPAFDRTKLIANTDQVDRDDVDVAALVTALLDFQDYRGAGFESLRYAVEDYGRRQK